MVESSKSASNSLRAIDLVLSCTICQKPLSTILAEDEGNYGLNGSKVTKLWLTECAHLTCATHLEGGGVPFHSNQQAPRAPCPLCTIEKDDSSKKALFYIHGASKGEYDDNIPEPYFQTPPYESVSGDTAFEAMRFQYVSLIRYAFKLYEKNLQSANALKQWECKKAEIVGGLSTVAPLRDELFQAGRRLSTLNQDVSSIEDVLNRVGLSLFHDQDNQSDQEAGKDPEITPDRSIVRRDSSNVGSRLARGSAADLDSLNNDPRNLGGPNSSTRSDSKKQSASSAKRQRESQEDEPEQQMHHLVESKRGPSRDLMPPPPVPRQQPAVHTVRGSASNLNEILGSTQQAITSQSPRLYGTPTRRMSESQLLRQPYAAPDHLPATPTHTAPTHNSIAAMSPHHVWPQNLNQARNGREIQLYTPAAPPLHQANTQRSPSFNQYRLHNPIDPEREEPNRLTISRRFGPPNGLGLSNNVRSSVSQPILSPAGNASIHRQAFGQQSVASPYFQPRGLPNSASRPLSRPSNPSPVSYASSYALDNSSLRSDAAPAHSLNRRYGNAMLNNPRSASSGESGRQGSFSSRTETLVDPVARDFVHHDDNTPSVIQHILGDFERGGLDTVRVQGYAAPRSDQLRARVSTAHPSFSSLRRRAHR
ncbi:hypothetical protein ACLMJK_007229 [Lecanora helva]